MEKETTPNAGCNISNENDENKIVPKPVVTEEEIESEIDRINPDENSMESRG
jgi:hypothetical protein